MKKCPNYILRHKVYLLSLHHYHFMSSRLAKAFFFLSAKIVLDADRNPIRFQKEGLNKLQLLLRILEVDSNGKALGEGKVVRTNSIDLNVGAVGRRMLVDYSNVLYGNVAEDSFGVYFWEHRTC